MEEQWRDSPWHWENGSHQDRKHTIVIQFKHWASHCLQERHLLLISSLSPGWAGQNKKQISKEQAGSGCRNKQGLPQEEGLRLSPLWDMNGEWLSSWSLRSTGRVLTLSLALALLPLHDTQEVGE